MIADFLALAAASASAIMELGGYVKFLLPSCTEPASQVVSIAAAVLVTRHHSPARMKVGRTRFS
jgi:hypothetical protein